jgi:PIN domain nuclease of toxin-antitoxin system
MKHERYLLDTNVALYFLLKQAYELDARTTRILDNPYNNLLHISVISIFEIIQLYKGNKIKTKWKQAKGVLYAIREVDFQILPLKQERLHVYADLTLADGHKAPHDHIIISQAIAERLTLISSDQKFEPYMRQNLKLIFNER